MTKLIELLNKHWDYLMQSAVQQSSETDISVSMGRSILINNMQALRFNEDIQNIILNKYDEMFHSSAELGNLPLNSHELINPLEYDVIGRVYESHIYANGTRRSSGQFYSPIEVVNYITRSLKLSEVDDLTSKRFIDIACGTGVFLLSAMKEYILALRKQEIKEEEVLGLALKNVYGMDINPISCLITKINIFNFIVLEFSPEVVVHSSDLHLNIYCANSIENRLDNLSIDMTTDYKVKLRMDDFSTGFHYIIGNPPYLEAKKMPKELKEICNANYENDIYGAFDLYIAFLSQCNRLVSENGIISLILPNKFTVARYASKIREKLLNKFTLLELADLSEMDIFSRADVYPIVFTYQNVIPSAQHSVKTKMSLKNYSDLDNEENVTYVPQMLYKQISEMHTFFCLPNRGHFEALFIDLFHNYARMDKYLDFRSTVSFHKKGLREEYVAKSFANADSCYLKKYLGGLSYSKKNEVGRYVIDWNEFYINYDNEKLKMIGNNLPPLTNFEREKIIFCQHAKEFVATYDGAGEWVTKDVYPIALAKDELNETNMSLKYLTGLLNSKLYSFLYGVIYKGIQIAGGYYHFLPTWMSILPIKVPNIQDIREVEKLVDEALSNQSNIDLCEDRINNKIFDIYCINEEQRELIYDFFGYKYSTELVKS